jgi:DNA-binding MarR family transcriptional regulator
MAEANSTRIARDLHMISALTRRVLEQGTADAECEISFTQLTVLKWLAVSPSRKAGDVARYLATSAPAATQIITRLKEKGLIRGRPNSQDRRAEDLTVSARARALIENHEQLKLRKLRTQLDALPEAVSREIAAGLESAIELLLRVDPQLSMCLHCSAYSSPICVMRRHGKQCPTDVVRGRAVSAVRRARGKAAAPPAHAPSAGRSRGRREQR